MDEKTIARFWSKVDKRGPDECWEWNAYRNKLGYGLFYPERTRAVYAHRLVFLLASGEPIGADLCACHHCDNPPCVNPSHLYAGTKEENFRDMIARGRQSPDWERRGMKTTSKLTPAHVVAIRAAVANGERPGAMAKIYGVSPAAISMLIHGRTWRDV